MKSHFGSPVQKARRVLKLLKWFAISLLSAYFAAVKKPATKTDDCSEKIICRYKK